MQKLNTIDWVTLILLIIGGLNWGLVGFFNFNLITAIFGEGTISGIIFALVGISAIYLLFVLGYLTKKAETTDERV